MAKNVIFVAPFPAEVTYRFARATAALPDVNLLGLVHTMPKGRDAKIFDDKVRVENPMSTSDLMAGVAELQRRHGKIHRILGVLESMQVQLAEVRAQFGIDGTDVKTADLFRDKAKMKVAFKKAGLPTARHHMLKGIDDAKAFANDVGFPMILKPPAGMGSKSTFRIKSWTELKNAMQALHVSPQHPMLAEEFLRGREFSFETMTVGGVVRMHSISHYLPTCLEAVENPWIQWCCVLPNDISGAQYDGARKLGVAAVKALGLKDGMTHMEWFERKDGSLAIGEIAQRPPGANISLMTGVAHGVDLYQAWAGAIVHGVFHGPWQRKYAVGSAFLRGMGKGRVMGVTGLKDVHQAMGKSVVEAKVPTVGAMKNDSYEGDGYVVVKDPSTDRVKAMLDYIINKVRVYYG